LLDDVCPKNVVVEAMLPNNGVVEPGFSVAKIGCVFDCGPFSNPEVGLSEEGVKVNRPKAGCVEVVEPDVDCPLPVAPKIEVAEPGAFPTDEEGVEKLVEPNGIEEKPEDCPVPPKDGAPKTPLPPLPNPGAELIPNLMVAAGASDVGAAAKAAVAPSVAPALFSELLVLKENF